MADTMVTDQAFFITRGSSPSMKALRIVAG